MGVFVELAEEAAAVVEVVFAVVVGQTDTLQMALHAFELALVVVEAVRNTLVCFEEEFVVDVPVVAVELLAFEH